MNRGAAGLILFVLGVGAGWIANDRLFTRDLAIEREITGVVQVVNVTGSKVCIIPDGKTEAEQNCSVLYQPPDRAPVKVGDRIGRGWRAATSRWPLAGALHPGDEPGRGSPQPDPVSAPGLTLLTCSTSSRYSSEIAASRG